MMLALLGTSAACLLVGYLLGRVRPWDRLDTWVWRRMTFGGPWTQSKWQCYLTFWVHAAVRPVQTWHAWQHRNDPPPPRSPAPKIEPDWAAKRRAQLADTDDQET